MDLNNPTKPHSYTGLRIRHNQSCNHGNGEINEAFDNAQEEYETVGDVTTTTSNA